VREIATDGVDSSFGLLSWPLYHLIVFSGTRPMRCGSLASEPVAIQPLPPLPCCTAHSVHFRSSTRLQLFDIGTSSHLILLLLFNVWSTSALPIKLPFALVYLHTALHPLLAVTFVRHVAQPQNNWDSPLLQHCAQTLNPKSGKESTPSHLIPMRASMDIALRSH